MTQVEIFRTRENKNRILVEQVIDGEEVDWFLVERREIATSDKLVAHTEAVKRFVGRTVNWTEGTTDTGYEFVVAR